jgi:hypothetical protein
MMGYSGGKWISPYTYKALMSRIPETFAAAGAGLAASSAVTPRQLEDRGCWIPIKQPQLFLRVDIHRDRSVDFRPAFHFLARPRPHGIEPTDFLVELLDDKGHVLRSACLYAEGAGCGCGCHAGGWPVKIRHAVAFDLRARTLVLYDCDKEIGKWPIPSPPKVSVDVIGDSDPGRPEIEVNWHAEVGKNQDRGKLWYLVQWRDRIGTWRGLAPRTQKAQLVVPKRIFKGERLSAIRVLASSGIATGEGAWEGEIRPPRDAPTGGVEVVLVGVGTPGPGAHALPRILRASLVTGAGAATPGAALRWFDGKGAELSRGRSFDLGNLRVGQHQISAIALNTGAGGGSATWLIEHTADGHFLLLVGDQKKRRRDDTPVEE